MLQLPLILFIKQIKRIVSLQRIKVIADIPEVLNVTYPEETSLIFQYVVKALACWKILEYQSHPLTILKQIIRHTDVLYMK